MRTGADVAVLWESWGRLQLAVDGPCVSVQRAAAALARLRGRAESRFRPQDAPLDHAARAVAEARALRLTIGQQALALTRADGADAWSLVRAMAGSAAASASGLRGEQATVALLGRLRGSPAAVGGVWAALSADRQAALVAAEPWLGGLDGIAWTDRDRANRVPLLRLADALDAAVDNSSWLRRAFDTAWAVLGPGQAVPVLADGRPVTLGLGHPLYATVTAMRAADQVLLFDPRGDGMAAVSFGDPSAAAHVAVVVPGIGNSLQNFHHVIGNARALYDAADHDGDVAVIAWLGYDTPGGITDVEGWTVAPLGERARDWGPALTGFVAATRANAADGARVTVVAHSYGSRLAAEAARGGGLDVDALVQVGSPGNGPSVHDVRDLGLDDGTLVWAESVGDPSMAGPAGEVIDRVQDGVAGVLRDLGLGGVLATLDVLDPVEDALATAGAFVRGDDYVPPAPSLHGRNPDEPGFGACGFALGDVAGHSQYFTGESLRSLAAIVRGEHPGPDTDRHAGSSGLQDCPS